RPTGKTCHADFGAGPLRFHDAIDQESRDRRRRQHRKKDHRQQRHRQLGIPPCWKTNFVKDLHSSSALLGLRQAPLFLNSRYQYNDSHPSTPLVLLSAPAYFLVSPSLPLFFLYFLYLLYHGFAWRGPRRFPSSMNI